MVLKLLLKQEIAIVLLLHGFEGSMRGTGKGFAGGLILLGILQGVDQADHLATTWPLGEWAGRCELVLQAPQSLSRVIESLP